MGKRESLVKLQQLGLISLFFLSTYPQLSSCPAARTASLKLSAFSHHYNVVTIFIPEFSFSVDVIVDVDTNAAAVIRITSVNNKNNACAFETQI